jgi:glycosyltransferase involved in cell wall biosynthesis
VLPSLSEALPLALLEAMSAGRPIVATNVGEVPAVLANGEAGLVVPPGDREALADAVAFLLSHPAAARTFGERAAQRAAAEYSLSRMTERYAALYQDLIRAAPALS